MLVWFYLQDLQGTLIGVTVGAVIKLTKVCSMSYLNQVNRAKPPSSAEGDAGLVEVLAEHSCLGVASQLQT